MKVVAGVQHPTTTCLRISSQAGVAKDCRGAMWYVQTDVCSWCSSQCGPVSFKRLCPATGCLSLTLLLGPFQAAKHATPVNTPLASPSNIVSTPSTMAEDIQPCHAR